MKRSTIGWVVAFILAFGGGALAWLWFAGGSGEPSTELTTPPIATETTEGGSDTTEGSDGSTDTTAGEPAVGANAYVIDSEQSSVTFELDEELRGDPTHVVGETDQVAGQVEVDISDLASAQMSQIVVNARTFATDSDRRDRAIRGPIILNSASDEHEFITFDVATIDGLSGSAAVGDTVDFTITGDLLIRGTTGEVTFDASVTIVDDSTIEGTASAEVLRSDFGIGIPSVPSVANVTDEVLLTITFVAVAG